MEVLQLLFFVKVVVAQADPHGFGLKTIEILQLQFFDEVVPSCPTALRGLVQFLDKVVDVPVAVYVGSASVTFLLLWSSSLESRASMTCLLGVGAGCDVFRSRGLSWR